MAAYNKYNIFTLDLINGIHDFDAHTFKIALTNAAPNASTHDERGDITELASGNGYTQNAAGLAPVVSTNQTDTPGTARAIPAGDITVTASGGTVGPFRYVVLYNDTAATDRLIAWWDYGSSITLADTETFTTDFGNTNATGFFGLA
jgi:hypothetical protein